MAWLKLWLLRQRNAVKQLSWFVIILGLAFLAVGLLGVLDWGWQYPPCFSDSLIDFHDQIDAELVGIGITVLVIDTANQLRQIQQDKKRLIREMRSYDNATALNAIAELRHIGWLENGSLRKAKLWRANLREARLWRANLYGVKLTRADLQRANLWQADLRNAALDGANLKGASLENERHGKTVFDKKAVLPDGTKWTPDTDMARFTDPEHPEFWRAGDPHSPAYRGEDANDDD